MRSIIPKLAAITITALELFQKCADCGIPVIVNDLSPALTVFGTNTPEAGSHAIIRLLSSENVTNVTSQSDALKSRVIFYRRISNFPEMRDRLSHFLRRILFLVKFHISPSTSPMLPRRLHLHRICASRSMRRLRIHCSVWIQKAEYVRNSQLKYFPVTGFQCSPRFRHAAL